MTPFVTNQQLETSHREKEEQKNLLENNAAIKRQTIPEEPLLELKLNQPVTKPTTSTAQEIYPSAYVPLPNPYYPYAANMMTPWSFTPNNVPVIKKYNISLGGSGDISRMANLYEDILPSQGSAILNTFNTLKERKILNEYIRSIFIRTGDGEEIMIDNNLNRGNIEVTNLLSHLKLLDINPHHYSKLAENPYSTLPLNYVSYKSCYPIKVGQFNNIECSKSNVGMIVRIYLLSQQDVDSTIKKQLSDVWRELFYYQFVREEIIKPNLSPNFVMLHSHYLTKNTGIDFKKFKEIKNMTVKNTNIEKLNNEIRNKLYLEKTADSILTDPNVNNILTSLLLPLTASKEDIINTIRQKREITSYLDSDKCMVMLTEAPTQHIYDWATRTYKIDNGPIKKMVQSGYHDVNVWESIFFQLMMSMLIMFEKKIIFTEFSLKNNVYIKDLRHNEFNVGFWKYIYDGIDYFIPNYGYLLLIDSNFAELTSTFKSFEDIKNAFNKPALIPELPEYRIKSVNFGDNPDEIDYLIIKNMISTFDGDNFGITFQQSGGVVQTDFKDKLNVIKNKLTEILNKYFVDGKYKDEEVKIKVQNEIKRLPIELIISRSKSFDFLNNRVGTPIKEQEKTYISESFDVVNTKRGSIVVRKMTPTFNTFAIYLGSNEIDQKYKILTTEEPIFNNENKKYKIMEIDKLSLLNYFGQPEQSFEVGKQFNILETYLISTSN